MYIRNFKLNGKIIFKIVFIILFILIFAMFAIGVYNIFKDREQTTSDNDDMPNKKINIISANNYTSVLKTVHNNLNSYLGTKIKNEKMCDVLRYLASKTFIVYILHMFVYGIMLKIGIIDLLNTKIVFINIFIIPLIISILIILILCFILFVIEKTLKIIKI